MGNKTSTRIPTVAVVVATAAALLAAGLQPAAVLVVRNTSTAAIIMARKVQPGDNLWLVYINSVENLPVAEQYRVDERRRLTFSETIYRSPYVGYRNEELARKVAPGTFRIAGRSAVMDAATFFAGSLSPHMLFFNGSWVPLYDRVQGGDLIRITVERTNRAGILFKKEIIP